MPTEHASSDFELREAGASTAQSAFDPASPGFGSHRHTGAEQDPVWEKQEITLTSTQANTNPCTEGTVWGDLTFKNRVYGFWARHSQKIVSRYPANG